MEDPGSTRGYLRSWPKKCVLGCVIPPLPVGASSRNLGHTFLAIVEPGSPLKHCFTHIFLDVNVLHGPQVQVGGDPNRSLPLVRPHPGVVDLQPWVVRAGVHEVAEGTRIARREAPRAVPEK